MARKIKISGSFVDLGPTARAVTYGINTGVPSDSSGNNGDIYCSTNTQDIWQKQSGTWVNVAWVYNHAFSRGPETDNPATFTMQFSNNLPYGGSYFTITTNAGSLQVGFYNSSSESSPGLNINIDINTYSNPTAITGQISSEITASYSSIVSTSSSSENLSFFSLDIGSSATITWDAPTLSSYNALLSSYTGTVFGSTTPGVPDEDPWEFKSAISGTRHLIQFGVVSQVSESNNTGGISIRLGGSSDTVIYDTTSSILVSTIFALRSGGIGLFGEPNKALTMTIDFSNAPGFGTTVTVYGFSLLD